ncbi:unnamed protein product [Paramecium octaurelia]|uniref:HTH myb-type domain-containing protein n=1 Tax=Paramecium octaurelia TaxID=43137 RepID=A0A8S1VZQ8_PAROT|nr:unnamed protein product [Paramecium octaurelia]
MDSNEDRSSQNDQANKLGILRKQKKKNEYDYHRKKRRGMEGSNSKKSGQKFTEEEDRLILQLVLNNGPKFQKIHRHFPGKTLAMVKNRYYKHLRFRWELLGQNYKHLSVPQEQLETLCEQQKKVSNILNAEKDDLITQITSRTTLLSNARMLVEYILVDYDSESNSDSAPEPKKPLNKVITLDHLNKMSKKIKTNEEIAVIVDQQSECDGDEQIPIQQQEIKNGKLHLLLPQPKNKVEQQHTTFVKKRLPPMPPGINFKEAEILSNTAIKKLTKEEQALIQEFDQDDIYMQDQKTINEKGIVKVTYEVGEDNAQIMNLHGTNEKYWEMEREKMKQKQEAFLKVPTDVNQLKREKNHIDSLNYQAALKQEGYESRKQDFKDKKEKMKATYGW